MKNTKKIVAINGTIGSGKDEFAKEFTNNGYLRLSFAETLKDTVAVLFGWDRVLLEGLTKESREWREQPDEYWSSVMNMKITPRWVLQNFGTDILRKHFHDNIWVFCLENKMQKVQEDKIIITDCRFSNELQMIRNNNGTIIEVQRVLPEWYEYACNYNRLVLTNQEIPISSPKEKYNIHESEYSWVGINNPDYVVFNDCTIEMLHQRALDIIKVLG